MTELQHLLSMANNAIDNYVIPGVTSYLIGNNNKVRLFHCTRNHTEYVVPHSHRFDFTARVLQGYVTNCIYRENKHNEADTYQVSSLVYGGKPGIYNVIPGGVKGYVIYSDNYHYDETYSMKFNEIHSISFRKDTYVLIYEGPDKTDTTQILQPYVNGEVIPTFKIEPWMFRRRNEQDKDIF